MAVTASFVFFADAHLRSHVWAGRPSLCGDAYYSFDQIVKYAVDRNLNIVSGGDLLDATKPPADAVAVIRQAVGQLHAAGLKLFGIDGNHDFSQPSWATLADATGSGTVEQVHKRVFTPAPGISAYGLNYLPADQLQPELAAVPATCDLVVCHQLADWAFSLPVGANMLQSWVAPHIKLVLLGDVHKAIERRSTSGALHIYPGSLSLQKIDEQPDKYFLHVNRMSDGTYECVRVPLRTRPFLSATIQDSDGFDQFLATVGSAIDAAVNGAQDMPETVRTPIIHVRLSPDIPGGVLRLREVVGIRAHLFVQPTRTSALPALPTGMPGTASPQVIDTASVLARVVNPQSEPDAFQFVHDLLTNDFDAVLAASRTRFQVKAPTAPQ